MSTLILKLNYFLIINLFLLQSLFAHSPSASRPVTWMPGLAGSEDNNRAGYGWLNSTSEAAAEGFFLDTCPQRGGGQLGALCLPKNSILGATAITDGSFTYSSLEASFVSMAREKAYEYEAMQIAAAGGEVPEPPECLRSDRTTAMRTFINNNRSKSLSQLNSDIRTLTNGIRAGSNTDANARRNLNFLEKMRAVKGAMEPTRLAQSYLLVRHLEEGERNVCVANANTTEHLTCLNVRRKLDRIRKAFPLIYEGGVLNRQVGQLAFFDGEDSIFANRDACGRTSRQRFVAGIYEMIGTTGTGSSLTGLSNNCTALRETVGAPSDSSAQDDAKLRASACRALVSDDERRLSCRGGGQVLSNLGRFNWTNLVNNGGAGGPGLLGQALNRLPTVNSTPDSNLNSEIED